MRPFSHPPKTTPFSGHWQAAFESPPNFSRNRIFPAHLGLDMTVDGDKEAAILAAADGTVEEAEYSAKKGYYLRIRHGNGLETLYAHCSSLLAEEGDSVSAGEQVAVMGSTGYSTGPHCHFEVLVNGQNVDPLSYLPTAE